MPLYDFPNGRIFVPKNETTFLGLDDFGNEIREHDVIQFWRDLRAAEDTAVGRPFPRILDSDPPQAAFDLARGVTILSFYSVEYDDASGTDAYKVRLAGANNNIADRQILNLVQLQSSNSAGLAQSTKIDETHTRLGLERGNALTDVPGGFQSADGSIDVVRTGDGETSSTLTRQ